MSKDTECPYCGEDVEINHDDGYGYSEDETHQQECGWCGKTFTYTTMIHFSYSTRKADCLNGGEHDYRKTATYPPEFARLRCKIRDVVWGMYSQGPEAIDLALAELATKEQS